MPCQRYKDALIEAAASGAAPSGELRTHLAGCASCLAAFAQEQSLFAAMDAGLRMTVNAEVPPSLLPRVSAGLDQVSVAPRVRWLQPLVFASGSVALILMVFLMTHPHRPMPEGTAKHGPILQAPVTPRTDTSPENAPPANTKIASIRANHSHTAGNSTILHSAASSNPEVLVPPDEREAYARFVATLKERSGVVVTLRAHASEKRDALVSADSLQIPDIEIKPLEGAEAETSAGASERR